MKIETKEIEFQGVKFEAPANAVFVAQDEDGCIYAHTSPAFVEGPEFISEGQKIYLGKSTNPGWQGSIIAI